MPPLQIDEHAGLLTGLAFLGFVLWKAWLRLRSDTRGDRAEAREHDAEGSVIAVLRDEVARLDRRVLAMSETLDEQTRARYAAERLARELSVRVETLEHKLRELGHTP